MDKPELMHPEDALIKIEALAKAAAFLVDDKKQIDLAIGILEIIASEAKRGLAYEAG